MTTRNILLIYAICSLLSVICYAQWLEDTRLTNSTGISSTGNESITVAGEVIHIAWDDDRSGTAQIYYKASADGGATWSPDARLTFTTSGGRNPGIKVSGPDVHVVWQDFRHGNYEIYYKRSTNGGFSWSPDIRLTNASGQSESPTITVTGQIIHIAWMDARDGNYEIYYKASGDGGVTWSPDGRITNNSAAQYYPSISVSGPVVHLLWQDNRDGNYEIYYKQSVNGGFSWGEDNRLTFSLGASERPSITSTGDILHATWHDVRDGNYEIYYKASGDGGANWSADGRMTNNSALSQLPCIFVSGPFVHLVWEDNRDGNAEIYYKFSTNGGFSWGTDTRLTNNPSSSSSPSVSASDTKVYVLWTDTRNDNSEIYFKKNPTGNTIGIIQISSEIPKDFSISQNYPNPFNPVTKIRFDIPPSKGVRGMIQHVKLVVYDITGGEVATLVNQQLNPGVYNVDFDASNLSSGVYFYRISADGFTDVKKMMLVK